MIDKEILLKPKIRICKLFLLPFAILILTILYIYLTGYQGRAQHRTVPLLIELNLSFYSIFILILIYLLSIFVIAYLMFAKDENDIDSIIIKNKTVYIDNPRYKMKFDLIKAKNISIKISKIWTLLYNNRYYRIGIVKFKYDNDRFSFFVPIRNAEIENNFKNLKIGLRK